MCIITYKKEDLEFKRTLFNRVQAYFDQNQLSKTGNWSLYIKSMLLMVTYLLIYSLMLFSQHLSLWFLCNAALGVLTIFLALNIGHDAAHHTFSSNRRVNNALLYIFDFLGASGYLWKLKHVYSHHIHVNIPGMDGDIKQSNLVRIFPNAPFLRIHRYQFLYMPILYLFYTLNWLLFRDFKDFFFTDISGKAHIQHPPKEYVIFFLGKAIFFFRMIGLPYLLLPFSFSTILLGFLCFHFVASFTVALALVSAHIGADSNYPSPDAEGNMPSSWIRHQILTTADFATEQPLITALFGGFNHHLVHHIFPKISHIHYPKLTEILIQTCAEYDMPYQSNASLFDAVSSHLKFLKMRSKAAVGIGK